MGKWHQTMLNKYGSIRAVQEEMSKRGQKAQTRYLAGNSDKAREMAQKRWAKYYAAQEKDSQIAKEQS